jgi:predicted nuclease with TOPRIM domain
MRTKKVVCFSSLVLLLSVLTCSVNSLSDTTVSFHGCGVTIDLTFPEEAHPEDNIWHNVTLTADIALTLHNLTIVIRSPVDSTLQETTGWSLFNRQLQKNEMRIEEINFQLPSNANGTLQCFIFVSTNQSPYYSSTTFYTTRVSKLTFSEMQTLYNEMLANYTSLQADFQSLLDEYDGLLANYSSLFANYTALLSQYNALSADYSAQVATYQALLDNYNKRSGEYDTLNTNYKSKTNEYSALQSDFSDLNSTHTNLQSNYNGLQVDYDQLNQTYTVLLSDHSDLEGSSSDLESAVNNDRIVMFIFVITLVALIAFIIYLKQEKEKPYVVIRKETVSMKEEGS